MIVKDLIALLNKYDGNAPVVIAGNQFQLGGDFEITETHQYNDEPEVRLVSGNQYQEE